MAARRSLKILTYNHLYNSIVNCTLMPGDVIVEQDVSNQLSVSRTPVREAIKMLEAEGLVYTVESTGTFVNEITDRDIEEIFQLRVMFEMTALKDAVVLLSDQDINEMTERLEALNGMGNNDAYYELDDDLHMKIIKCSNNTRLFSFYNKLKSQLEQYRRISAMTPNRLNKSKQEHFGIVEAIKARNLEDASERLVQHLENVKQSTIDARQTLRMQRVGMGDSSR